MTKYYISSGRQDTSIQLKPLKSYNLTRYFIPIFNLFNSSITFYQHIKAF